VPSVKGKTLAAARAALAKKRCAAGKVALAYSTRVQKGRVIAQSAPAGRSLKRGSKVGLVVSRGAKRR
jgi:eukaryotic-like serine/threonine-protein kinase